ncbi:MAG: WGR domain-containing protein [Pseudomonadota bacterium]
MQLDLFPQATTLGCIDSAVNRHHHHRMSVQGDLFGGATLVREWGRIGRVGQLRLDHYDDDAQAFIAMAAIDQAKRKRGYC